MVMANRKQGYFPVFLFVMFLKEITAGMFFLISIRSISGIIYTYMALPVHGLDQVGYKN